MVVGGGSGVEKTRIFLLLSQRVEQHIMFTQEKKKIGLSSSKEKRRNEGRALSKTRGRETSIYIDIKTGWVYFSSHSSPGRKKNRLEMRRGNSTAGRT